MVLLLFRDRRITRSDCKIFKLGCVVERRSKGKVQSNLQGLGAKPKMISLLERSFYLNLTTLPTLLQTTTALINTLKPCPFGRSRAVLLYCDAVSQIPFVARPEWVSNRHSSKHEVEYAREDARQQSPALSP